MNFKTFWKSRGFKSWFCAFIPIFALLFTVCLLLTCNSFLYQTLNSTALGGERRVLISGDPDKYQYYTADYKNKKEVLSAANAFNEEMATEGIVMLKYDGKTLPVAADGKVTVFGKNTTNLVLGGSGSNASSGGGNVKTIYDSLDAVGIEYNPEMRKFYEDNKRSGEGRPQSPDMNSSITGLTGFPTGETPASAYDEQVRSSWSGYNDLAIVVVSRIGGEGFDLPRSMFWDGKGYQNWDGDQAIPGARNKDDHYLQLDQNETDMIKTAADNFEKVVVVINSPTAMELGFLDDPEHYAYSEKIGACLWIGTPGNTGIMGLGRVLNGEISPSGRTVDTYARDFKKDPTWNNFANNLISGGNQYTDESGEKRNAYFVHYTEGIYVGYRYYETRAYEEEKSGNADWYGENVVFPFGYGLSYTDFEWTVESVSQSGTLNSESPIEVTVNVTNKGNYAGKEVVELYYSAPYTTTSNIEKSHVALGDFAKTGTLQPGESEKVTLKINPRDMASYDWSDINKNGKKCYELEAGDYTFYVARNAHDRSKSFELTLNSGVFYETDDKTGNDIENLFDDVSERIPQYMSRLDFEGTFPGLPDKSLTTLSESEIKQLNSTFTDNATDPWYTTEMPSQSAIELSRDETTVKLYDLIGKAHDDPMWDELLDQLTVSQMKKLIEIGNYHTEAIECIDKPQTIDPDGPMGYSLFMGNSAVYDTCYYASESLVGSTWNKDIAERFGKMIGNESLIGNEKGDGRTYAGWYAPAVNLHRSPFGGRNFEYYSEDPVLSAKMAVGVIRGAKSKGVYTYIKHFALNDQETNRDTNGIAVWANEQSMRELYFLPFEKAVKDGGTTAIMSSFNRIGFTWAGGDYRLLTQLLRDEWGFRGTVVTDYNLPTYMNVDQMIRAGGDLNLSQSKALKSYESATAITAIRNAAHNILYTVANSNAMNGMGEGNVWGYARPIWFICMWCVFAVITAGLLVWGFFVCRKVIVAYRAGVRAGTIIPAKRERDPNYKPTVISRIFLGAIAFVATAGIVLSAVMMSTPPASDSVEQTFNPYIGGITVTLNNAPLQNNAVTLELGSDTERLTVLVDAYGMSSGGVTYVSSDRTVAEVSDNGTLTAKSVGECSVTVSVNADPSVYETVLVRVINSDAADNTARAITVNGGYANVSQAVPGTTVFLTPTATEGMTFVGWSFDVEVTSSGNMFIMPASEVNVTAVYKKNGYTLTLEGATFANGEKSKELLYGDPIPSDITLDDPLGANEYMFGWENTETGEVVESIPAGNVTVRPLVLERGAQLVMGKNGFDYNSQAGLNAPSAKDTEIDGSAAKQINVAEGAQILRIKNGGVTGADNDKVYVTVVLRNDSAFDVTLKYEIESYGAIWGPEPVTIGAGETVTLGIVVQGLGSDQTPYHRILFDGGAKEGTTISFCGYLMQKSV